MEYVSRGRLVENGQTMDFPVIEKDGSQKTRFRASYHVQTRRHSDLAEHDNLVYITVPERSRLYFGNREVPVQFKQGDATRLRTINVEGPSITTDGFSLVKIHPGVPYSLITPPDGTYHLFEMLETPDSYHSRMELHNDFVELDDEQKSKLGKPLSFSDFAVRERGSKLITAPGIILYPDYSAFRLPGWLAKEFNGSPEFGFAYSPFDEPREGEVLHHHEEMMEPYMGIEGVAKLFVEMDGGSERLTVKDRETEKPKEYRGEILELGKGDVLLPMPGVRHRLLFGPEYGAEFPFNMYCINYAGRNLDKVPASDRVVHETK